MSDVWAFVLVKLAGNFIWLCVASALAFFVIGLYICWGLQNGYNKRYLLGIENKSDEVRFNKAGAVCTALAIISVIGVFIAYYAQILLAAWLLGDTGLMYVLGKDYMLVKGVSTVLPKVPEIIDKFLA